MISPLILQRMQYFYSFPMKNIIFNKGQGLSLDSLNLNHRFSGKFMFLPQVTEKREATTSRYIPSSFGQFLFYRPVRTVTGLIIDEEELFSSQLYYIQSFKLLQHFF